MSRDMQAETENKSDIIIGPILPFPSDNLIGSAVPPNSRPNNDAIDNLPNVLAISNDIYGPVLPANLQQRTQENTRNLKTYGPSLPPSFEEKSLRDNSFVEDYFLCHDDDSYGPLPPGVSLNSRALEALEERALEIKLSSINSNNSLTSQVREEWMTVLPKVGSGSLGLGTKHFRKNDRPDFSDRSSWTDTPLDKANKLHGETEKNVREIAELHEAKKRDREQSKMAKAYKKKNKRDNSLLEMHQNKLLKKLKTDAGEASVRRPFNRETDLKVNVFDEAQKKVIMKKAMHLDDRFSRGQTKFL